MTFSDVFFYDSKYFVNFLSVLKRKKIRNFSLADKSQKIQIIIEVHNFSCKNWWSVFFTNIFFHDSKHFSEFFIRL